MRTTVRLRDDLLKRARQRAAAEGRTLTSLIEEGLNLVLAPGAAARGKRIRLPVSRASGGLLPGVNVTRSGELEDLMNARDRG